MLGIVQWLLAARGTLAVLKCERLEEELLAGLQRRDPIRSPSSTTFMAAKSTALFWIGWDALASQMTW